MNKGMSYEEELRKNKERIRKYRENKSEVETEFEKINLKHQNRDRREKRSGKEN